MSWLCENPALKTRLRLPLSSKNSRLSGLRIQGHPLEDPRTHSVASLRRRDSHGPRHMYSCSRLLGLPALGQVCSRTNIRCHSRRQSNATHSNSRRTCLQSFGCSLGYHLARCALHHRCSSPHWPIPAPAPTRVPQQAPVRIPSVANLRHMPNWADRRKGNCRWKRLWQA